MHDVNMATIKCMCQSKDIRWTDHIFKRLLQRGISTDDVENALLGGEIIEHYPDDYPYPSCLVLGLSKTGDSLHVVCGLSDRELWLITSYYPDEEEWEVNFKTRKGYEQ